MQYTFGVTKKTEDCKVLRNEDRKFDCFLLHPTLLKSYGETNQKKILAIEKLCHKTNTRRQGTTSVNPSTVDDWGQDIGRSQSLLTTVRIFYGSLGLQNPYRSLLYTKTQNFICAFLYSKNFFLRNNP